jgi:PKD repeat protein
VESGNTLMFGDVNGDGWLDLVVAYNDQLGGDGYFRVYFNNGAGMLDTLYGWQSSSDGYGSALALCDYDDDGDLDLAAGRWFQPIHVYENLGTTFETIPGWISDVSIVAEELAWVDIDGRDVRKLADTIDVYDDRRLFYTIHEPLYAIDSVRVDGVALDHPDYCYDLVSGWVSLAVTPTFEVEIYYRYSFANDLACSDWDSYNSTFANTREPGVRMYADILEGDYPLTVQFSDSTVDAYNWRWNFGDGTVSHEQNPQHTYTDIGVFTVDLQVSVAGQTMERTVPGMIYVAADTLRFGGKAVISPGYVSIPVTLTNSQPISEIVVPFQLTGTMSYSYRDWDIVGCRTDYFEKVQLVSIDEAQKKYTLLLRAGKENPPLPAGSGPIFNLNFLQYSQGSITIDTTTHGSRTLSVESYYLDNLPTVMPGHIYWGLCGNLDGSPDGLIDILDLTHLISYLYIGTPPPPYSEQANVNGSADGVVDIADLTYLIAYLWLKGPPPVCPP